MARVSELVDDTVSQMAQEKLETLGYNAKGIIKLKAIVAANEHGISAVASIFSVTRNTITSWIKKFKEDPESILVIGAGRGKKPSLNDSQLNKIKSWIKEDSNITIKELRQKIKDKFGVVLEKSAVHNVMKKLAFSYITPRPKHYKQDTLQHEEFKKKSKSGNGE